MKITAILAFLCALIILGCGGGGGGSVTGGGNNGGSTGAIQDAAGQPISGAIVKFYDGSGTPLGQAQSNENGAFSGAFPAGATKFTVDLSQVPNSGNYFNQFGYNGKEYLANSTGCLATLPSGSGGQPIRFATPIVITPRWMGPPPPPNGCLSG